MREVLATVWVVAHLPLPTGWIVSPPDVIAVLAGLAAFIVLVKNQRVNLFISEVIGELSKVVWPNRKETVLSTGVVSILVGICAVILFLFDTLWGSIIKIFYS